VDITSRTVSELVLESSDWLEFAGVILPECEFSIKKNKNSIRVWTNLWQDIGFELNWFGQQVYVVAAMMYMDYSWMCFGWLVLELLYIMIVALESYVT
jgi:hypothetical protein